MANWPSLDRKSTRLNSSHTVISYAVFCLKKKNVDLPSRLANGQAIACFFPFQVLLRHVLVYVFFFNDTATTEIYTLSLHDALPISRKTPSVRRIGAEPTLTRATPSR